MTIGRQWLGNPGKVDNGVVGVHLSYSAPGFQCLLDSHSFICPKVGLRTPRAEKKKHVPDDLRFHTKQEILMSQIDRALANGLLVAAWTFDEVYGRDSKFLDCLDDHLQRDQP